MLIELTNESKIEFKGADDPDSLLGPGLDRIGIDEAQDVKKLVFDKTLRPMLIGKSGHAMLIGTKRRKPNWFREEWIKSYQGQVLDSQVFYFPSTANPTVSHEEWDRERKTVEPWIWDREYISDPFAADEMEEGLKYPEFDRRLHIAMPFNFDDNYRHFRGIDWGVDHPTVCVWAAVHKKTGHIYIYDEYSKTSGNVAIHCHNILKQTKHPIAANVLDVACWHRESDNFSIAMKFKQYGLDCQKAKKENRVGFGFNCVKTYLHPVEGPPKISFFPHVKELLTQLETLRWSDSHKVLDDLSDALRYLVVFLSSVAYDDALPAQQDNDPGFYLDQKGIYQYRLPKHSTETVNWDDSGYLS